METVRRLVLVVSLAVCALEGAFAQAPVDCQQAEECRQRALEAPANAQYERFHDLAWRAIQTGAPNDPESMYLLARAQALSGRRRDALVVLRRLADMGVATEAATEDDLRRVRELPGWTDIAARFDRLRAERLAAGTSSPSPAGAPAGSADAAPAAGGVSVPAPPPRIPTATPAIPAPRVPAAAVPAVTPPPARVVPAPAERSPAAAASAVAIDPLPATDVARFSTAAFSPAGLAYDEVSRRFLFGDTQGRRLFVVSEGSTRLADLVRGDSAGFHEVTGLEIGRRGDLWVTSTAADGTAAALHRLQLISGRTLETFAAPGGAPVALTDLAVTPDGSVLTLDGSAPRVLRLRPGAKAIETAMALDLASPVSLTAGSNDRTVFIAHAGGLVRVDLQQRAVRALAAPAGLALDTIERIRWHRNTLVAIQRRADGARALAILQLDSAGTRVTGARVIDAGLDGDSRTPLLTIVGDDVYYSLVEAAPADGASVDVLVRRIRLP
jgi:hypothetical protein